MNEKKIKYLIYAVILIIVFGSCSVIDNEYFETNGSYGYLLYLMSDYEKGLKYVNSLSDQSSPIINKINTFF